MKSIFPLKYIKLNTTSTINARKICAVLEGRCEHCYDLRDGHWHNCPVVPPFFAWLVMGQHKHKDVMGKIGDPDTGVSVFYNKKYKK